MTVIIGVLLCCIAASLIIIIALLYDIYQILRHGK